MSGLLNAIREFPPIRRSRELRFDREFDRQQAIGCFRGVYGSFDEARASLPAASRTGYDQPGTGGMYRDVLATLREWDYPVLFWLSQQPGPLKSVFDYGGHIGILYYGFSKYLVFDQAFRWTVYDVPEINREGTRLALERDASSLGFTCDLKDAEDCEIFLASGSPQYFEESFHDTLARLETPPDKVLLNMIPLHDSEEFVTVNSMPASFVPYKVFHKQRFLDGMQNAGWILEDLWENKGKACHVPFHETHSESRYYGMYYVR